MKKRVRYLDGVRVEYSSMYPKGLTDAIFAPAPSCHVEHGYQLRLLREQHKRERYQARLTWIQIQVWTRQLAEKRADLAVAQAKKEREENLDDYLFGPP